MNRTSVVDESRRLQPHLLAPKAPNTKRHLEDQVFPQRMLNNPSAKTPIDASED
jgi:hypothetical protein